MLRITLHSFTPPSSPLGFGSLGLLTGTSKVMEMVNLGKSPALTNQIAWGKVSLKSLEITSDNQAVSHRLSAFNEHKTLFC